MTDLSDSSCLGGSPQNMYPDFGSSLAFAFPNTRSVADFSSKSSLTSYSGRPVGEFRSLPCFTDLFSFVSILYIKALLNAN